LYHINFNGGLLLMAENKTNLDIIWNGGTTGNGTLKGEYLDTKIAIPTSMKGSGDGTDPKELLISSAATCYITTLSYMLETRKLSVVELTMNSEATMSDNGLKFIHFPQIVLTADATEHQVQSAQRALDGADKACEVGNLLKNAGVIIEIEGEVSLK
jgi:peroxiredoxin-like protein